MENIYFIFHLILLLVSIFIGLILIDKNKLHPITYFIYLALIFILLVFSNAFNLNKSLFIVSVEFFIFTAIFEFIRYNLSVKVGMEKIELILYILFSSIFVIGFLLNNFIINKLAAINENLELDKYIATIWTVHATSAALLGIILNFVINISDKSKYGIEYKNLSTSKNIVKLSSFTFVFTINAIVIQFIPYLTGNLGLSIGVFISNLLLILGASVATIEILTDDKKTNETIKSGYLSENKHYINIYNDKDLDETYYSEANYKISILCDDIMEQYRKNNYINFNDDLALVVEMAMQFRTLDKDKTTPFFNYFDDVLHNMLNYFDRENYYEFYFILFNLLFFQHASKPKYKENVIINMLEKIAAFGSSGLYNNSTIKNNGIKKYTYYLEQLLRIRFKNEYDRLLFNHCYGSMSYILTSYIQFVQDDLVDDISKEYLAFLIKITKANNILVNSLISALNFDLLWLITSKKGNSENYKLPTILNVLTYIKKESFDPGIIIIGNLSYLFSFMFHAKTESQELNTTKDLYSKYWEYNKTSYDNIFNYSNILQYVKDYISIITKKMVSRYIDENINLIIFFLLCFSVCFDLFQEAKLKKIFELFAKSQKYTFPSSKVPEAFNIFVSTIENTSDKKISKSNFRDEIIEINEYIQK